MRTVDYPNDVHRWGARRALAVVVWGALLVAGPALPAYAAADPVGPPTVSQSGIGVGRLIIDPTAGNAETDIRISTNGVALGDFVLGRPDATPEHARGLDLELANVRISD
jgi:hypothetical protein